MTISAWGNVKRSKGSVIAARFPSSRSTHSKENIGAKKAKGTLCFVGFQRVFKGLMGEGLTDSCSAGGLEPAFANKRAAATVKPKARRSALIYITLAPHYHPASIGCRGVGVCAFQSRRFSLHRFCLESWLRVTEMRNSSTPVSFVPSQLYRE